MRLQNGDLVRVKAYGGQTHIRRLLEVRGQTAIITTDEERRKAAKEKREPICIGFPLADVIEVVERKDDSK